MMRQAGQGTWAFSKIHCTETHFIETHLTEIQFSKTHYWSTLHRTVQYLQRQSGPSAVCLFLFSQLSCWMGRRVSHGGIITPLAISFIPDFHSLPLDGKGALSSGHFIHPRHQIQNSGSVAATPFIPEFNPIHEGGSGITWNYWLKTGLVQDRSNLSLRGVITRASACLPVSFITDLFSQIQGGQWDLRGNLAQRATAFNVDE